MLNPSKQSWYFHRMALVRENLASFQNDSIAIDSVYDDVTLVVVDVITRNRGSRTLSAEIWGDALGVRKTSFTQTPRSDDQTTTRRIPSPARPLLTSMPYTVTIKASS